MSNCVFCQKKDYGIEIKLFEEVCKPCRKQIKKRFPDEYSKEYQIMYREKHLPKMGTYQKKYREIKKPINRELKGIPIDKKPERSRFYICKLGDDFLKIGSTFIGSDRIYHVERKARLQGLSLEILYFFDCRNDFIIKQIEGVIKKAFCDPHDNKNNNFFPHETTKINNLEIILLITKKMLDNSNLTYELLNF